MYFNSKQLKNLCIAFLTVFCLANTSMAQPGKRLRNNALYAGYNTVGELTIHGGLGVSHYFGDISYNHLEVQKVLFTKPYMQVGVTTRFHERISMRIQAAVFQLWGLDNHTTPNKRRGINFVSENFEGSVIGIFDIIPQNKQTRIKWSPYAFVGFGLMYFRPRTQDSKGNWYDVRSLQLEGNTFRPITPTLPFGLGLRYKIDKQWTIGAEMSYRLTASDYLDGASTTYDLRNLGPEAPTFLANSREGRFARQNQQRGNKGSRDGFFSATVFLEYKIMKKPASAKYKRRRR
jgi:opacity protein-like surface antigen